MNNGIEKFEPGDAVSAIIPGFSDYKIDEVGNVYSRRRERAKGGKLRQQIGSHGYKTVCLWRNKKSHTKCVHQLVLESFMGPRPRGKEVCHINGIRLDNRLENLRWDTRKNNIQDKIKHGTYQYGENNPSSKLTEEKVRNMCSMFDGGSFSIKSIADIYNVPYGTVYYIVKRLRWKHLWEN